MHASERQTWLLRAGLCEREAAVKCAEAQAQEQLVKIREGRTDEFLVELRSKERELAVLIRHAQEVVASQSGTSESKTRLPVSSL